MLTGSDDHSCFVVITPPWPPLWPMGLRGLLGDDAR
jgi:hypothetical protein